MSAKKKLDGVFPEIPRSYASDSHSLPKDQSILEYLEQTGSEGGRVCQGYGLLIRKKSNEGHLKVIFQTTLWFSFVLTQPT